MDHNSADYWAQAIIKIAQAQSVQKMPDAGKIFLLARQVGFLGGIIGRLATKDPILKKEINDIAKSLDIKLPL